MAVINLEAKREGAAPRMLLILKGLVQLVPTLDRSWCLLSLTVLTTTLRSSIY